MKIGFIWSEVLNSAEAEVSIGLANALKDKGVEILLNNVEDDCDFIYGSSVAALGKIKNFHQQYPNIKMINYNWDLYGWAVNKKCNYDWAKYEELLKDSEEIWCPSNEVILRTEEFYNLGNKCKILPAYVNYFEIDKVQPHNDKFIYKAIREYKKDPNFGFIEKACSELKITLDKSIHTLSYEEFQNKLLSCSFLVCDVQEASTGGLSLLQAFYHGKNVLLSDSIYQGGRDYFGDKAYYFEDGNYNDLLEKVKMLWDKADEPVNLIDRKEHCEKYKIEPISNQMLEMFNNLK